MKILAVLALAAVSTAQAQEEIRAGQTASLTGRIDIYNVSGRITMRRGTGNAVTVKPTSQGADGAGLQYFVDRSGNDSSVFRVVYPADVDAIAAPDGEGGGGWNGGRTSVRLRADGTFGGDSDNWSSRRGRRGSSVDVGGRGGFRGWADLEITVPRGANVRVHLVAGMATIEGVDGHVVIDTWEAGARATNIAGEWVFDTGSGDVEVTGMNGTLHIDTGSGSGVVSGMRGDLLDVDTGSGSVDVRTAQVERCRFDTGSGDVTVSGLTARRCVADTGSGSVRLDYTGGTIDDLVIDTGSGRVNLTLPPSADVRVSAETGSGGINIVRAGALFERRTDDVTVLRFGEGRGRISIDTGSGGVTIR